MDYKIMTSYDFAAKLFGNSGVAGEGNALAEYCLLLKNFEGNYDVKNLPIYDNIVERCADELNHVLGDLLDAIKLSGLKIGADGIDEIFEGLKNAVKV